MAESHANFAYSTVLTAPSPNRHGTSLVVQSGNGALFPTAPFTATVWPAGEQPTSTNSEIICVTAKSTDTFTIVRAREGTTCRYIIAGDQIAATITAKTLTDAENVGSTWSPYVLASGANSVLQTLNSGTGSATSGSVFVFPVTVAKNIQFNQIMILNSISVIQNTTNSLTAAYYSKYGLYSMNANTLSLISSSSFSIGETLSGNSASWYYPTTTNTTGYGYGSFPQGGLTTSGQYQSFLTGTRMVGLQFGGNINLSHGIYWLGVLSLRSTTNLSTFGMSHSGIIGQAINAYNSVGSVSGALPLGYAGSEWTNLNTHSSGWFGRHIIGFITATSITNQAGTAIPSAITLSALGAVAAASTVSVLPTVTFVST